MPVAQTTQGPHIYIVRVGEMEGKIDSTAH